MELPIKMVEEEYKQGSESYQGVCLACGAYRDCCEPDAEGYPCESCEERQVMGFEQAMICGHIELIEEES